MPPATLTRSPDAAGAVVGVTPERSLAQRLHALDRANRVRTRRSALKRDMKAGCMSVATVLRDQPDYVATMKVSDLLLAVPNVGQVKARKILKRCLVSPTKTVGGLSHRQRTELVQLLRGGQQG